MLHPITSTVLAGLPGIRHGFFTRRGGASTGLYGSLNCGLGSQDERASVNENRSRVAGHLGAQPGQLLTVHQVHSAIALTVDRCFGAEGPPRADAMATRTPGLVVAALAADCTPVLFADPHARVVAAAHAGWRGALGGIIEATLFAMERLGARRADIRAAIGPCIHQDSYEVGAEFEAQFLSVAPENSRFFAVPPGKSRAHFDLPGYVHFRLAASGIGAITPSSACTYRAADHFYSYRRSTHLGEPDYGRQISAIVVA